MSEQVSSARFPYIPIRLSPRGTNQAFEIDALVDTGFDGDLILPTSLSSAFDRSPGYQIAWRLADGSSVLTPTFQAEAEVVGLIGRYVRQVSILGSEVLVGRGFIQEYRLIFDHGQRVIIEP